MYLNNVGYFDTLIKESFGNFLLINSLNSAAQIRSYIENLNKDFDKSKFNIILTHSRIWDDNLISKSVFSHDKSYFFNEIDNHVFKKINCVFSGNSPSQYFGSTDSTKKANNNIIYWCDMVKNISCYSIGMGGTKNISNNRVNFVRCEILGNKICLESKSYIINSDTSTGFTKSKDKKYKIKFVNVFLILKSRKFYFGVLVGWLLFLFVKKF